MESTNPVSNLKKMHADKDKTLADESITLARIENNLNLHSESFCLDAIYFYFYHLYS